jgi:hypothetical protein
MGKIRAMGDGRVNDDLLQPFPSAPSASSLCVLGVLPFFAAPPSRLLRHFETFELTREKNAEAGRRGSNSKGSKSAKGSK